MVDETGSRRNEGGHLVAQFELPFGGVREHRDKKVLHGDHLNAEVFDFGVYRLRDI
ncbi:MAG: hypothetical protein ABI410_01560 [Rhodoferax sp.]|uniref:hypothetical protein n=1 Tax=Rhodoferax sp. TaxID=50421 RepID=UPI003267D442